MPGILYPHGTIARRGAPDRHEQGRTGVPGNPRTQFMSLWISEKPEEVRTSAAPAFRSPSAPRRRGCSTAAGCFPDGRFPDMLDIHGHAAGIAQEICITAEIRRVAAGVVDNNRRHARRASIGTGAEILLVAFPAAILAADLDGRSNSMVSMVMRRNTARRLSEHHT